MPPATSVTATTPLRLVGHGPVRVLVCHGWIADHTLFDPLLALIDEGQFTVALPDCRGYGARRDEPGPYTVETVAADALAFATRLGWTRFHLIGHSMGGMAAQRLLIDAPERIASLLLLAPVSAGGARLPDERRALLRRAIAEPAARREVIARNTGGAWTAEGVERVLRLSLETTRADALAAYIESWSDTGFEREVRPARVPLHVVLGALDPGASPERLRETLLRWHPRATCEVLAGVGHYPMQESPARLAAIISGFLLAAEMAPRPP